MTLREGEQATRDGRPELEELRFTLQVYRRALPSHAHPAHVARLDNLAGVVRQGAAAPCRTTPASHAGGKEVLSSVD